MQLNYSLSSVCVLKNISNTIQSNLKTSASMGLLACLLLLGTAANADQDTEKRQNISAELLEKNIALVEKSQEAGRQSQRQIEKKAAALEELKEKIVSARQEISRYKANISHLEKQRSKQEALSAELKSQLALLEGDQTKLIPLAQQMIQALQASIRKDLPFHLTERSERITSLSEEISEPGTNISEVFRRTFEAYEIERDFGYSIEAYRQAIQLEGQEQISQILRIGRTALYFLSLDNQTVGHWDQTSSQWQTLPRQYLQTVKEGLAMANETKAPNILTLPLNSPTTSIQQSGN